MKSHVVTHRLSLVHKTSLRVNLLTRVRPGWGLHAGCMTYLFLVRVSSHPVSLAKSMQEPKTQRAGRQQKLEIDELATVFTAFTHFAFPPRTPVVWRQQPSSAPALLTQKTRWTNGVGVEVLKKAVDELISLLTNVSNCTRTQPSAPLRLSEKVTRVQNERRSPSAPSSSHS